MKKNCLNCKYIEFQYYGKNECRNPKFTLIVESNTGHCTALIPLATKINPEITDECPHFKLGIKGLINDIIGKLHCKYLNWRYNASNKDI